VVGQQTRGIMVHNLASREAGVVWHKLSGWQSTNVVYLTIK
jgi:hypothetical protein